MHFKDLAKSATPLWYVVREKCLTASAVWKTNLNQLICMTCLRQRILCLKKLLFLSVNVAPVRMKSVRGEEVTDMFDVSLGRLQENHDVA